MLPAEYVTELANRAFKAIESGSGEEIRKIVGTPQNALALAEELALRPDFQAQVASLVQYTPSQWILNQELDQVDKRREKLGQSRVASEGDAYKRAAKSALMGLCFSGGGIRSATFNLGILQGLAELRLLRCFDYLSTVSGGGYVHQWLAAWSRNRGFTEVEKQLIPLPDDGNPGSHPEPIRWLRRYSNYLTPEKGLLTADTWVAFGIWLRNTLLNQAILISGLFFLALLPHLAASHQLVPKSGAAAAVVIGIICFLSAIAVYFVGENLWRFADTDSFGQGAVEGSVVLPFLISAALLTLLFPLIASEPFSLHLSLAFLSVTLVMFALALTIAVAGGAPFAYLKNHHETSAYDSVGAFWEARPKCFLRVKFIIALVGLFAAAVIAALGGAVWIAGTVVLMAKMWTKHPIYSWRLTFVIGPPLALGSCLVTMLLIVGLLGRTFQDARREWLSRMAAWIGLFMLFWIGAFGFSLLGYRVVEWLWLKFWAVGAPAFAAWAVTSLGGLLAAKSPKSSGTESDEAPGFSPIDLLARVGPFVFIGGLLLLISAAADVVFRHAKSDGAFALVTAYILPLAICWLFSWRVDVNEFSLHAFYRNRLSRCYLGASNTPRHPNPFTGFDDEDTTIHLSELLPGEGKKNYYGPFPIFCTALNLTFGEDLAWQERKAASFAFTPLFSGYDVPWTASRNANNKMQFNGFVKTENYAYPKPGIHINTAAAISGAAVSPNMGYHSSPAAAFLLTMFSVRLGWWINNPRVLNENGTEIGDPQKYPWPSPRISLGSLASELLGRADDTRNYVYLSDGGHFDNMGVYELVRRRCRYIVICDAEDDHALTFGGIGMAIRKCRIDFGAEISLDLRCVQHAKDSAYSSDHCVVGTIRYPEDPPKSKPGIVVYIKSSLTGDEPADVLNYKKEHPVFPNETTLNQWFSESQFESYRRLGHHIAYSVLEPALRANKDCDCDCANSEGRKQFFENLQAIWWAPTAEMDRFTPTHTTEYEKLLEKARTDTNLPGFFDAMFSGKLDWKTNATSPDQVEYATRFSSELFEFIFMVFNQLGLVLPEKRNHPYARGWSRIFKQWAKIDVVRDGWDRYRLSYSRSFRRFAESDDFVGLPPGKDPVGEN